MFRPRTPSVYVHLVRPTIEALEERTVLSDAAYTGVLSNFSASISSNIAQLNALSQKFNQDVAAYDQNPGDINALINLAVDGQNLQLTASQLQEQANIFGNAVVLGEQAGLVTGSVDTFLFEKMAQGFLSASDHFQNVGEEATGDFIAAFFAFTGNASAKLNPLPTPTPNPTPTGNATVTSFNVPGSAPASTTVTASAHIVGAVPGSMATLSVTGTDGFSKSNSATLSDGSGTVTLTIPGGAKGVKDTVTLTVAGTAINQQATCVYT